MKASKLAMGAVLGAAIGVAAGILTAPKSGRETRDDIKRKADEAKAKAATKRDNLMFKAEELSDDVRAKASETIENLKTPKK